jgi:hypothetical protein
VQTGSKPVVLVKALVQGPGHIGAVANKAPLFACDCGAGFSPALRRAARHAASPPQTPQ